MRKIIVVTPVKNEAWILERYLAVTSQFADHIIIADQRSTDASRAICAQFPKVHLIVNDSDKYDEAHRQKLLLSAARTLVPEEKFILALDADEILTADSLKAPSWAAVQTAAAGTVFYYEKPDMLPGMRTGLRHSVSFPLGYVDDGAPQVGQLIHSARVPLRAGHPRVEVADILFMHLALVRPVEYRARQRLYSMLEKINRTKSLWLRLAYYSPAIYRDKLIAHAHPVPATWLQGWQDRGIDFHSFAQSELNHYNQQALRLQQIHGTRLFFYDDIWDTDWQQLAADFAARDGIAAGPREFSRPSVYHQAVRRLLLIGLKMNAARHGLRAPRPQKNSRLPVTE